MICKNKNAMQVLERLIGICDVDEFLRCVESDQLYLMSADRELQNDLISYEELSEILQNSRSDNPGLRLARNGSVICPKKYTFSYYNFQGDASPLICHKAVYDFYLNGATIIYDNIEERSSRILEVIKSMEYLVGEYCSAHLYVSKEKESGLDIHWDDHDVVVLQLHGKKKWSIYQKDIEYPIRADRLEDPGKPGELIRCEILSPGDILYLPRGYWHLPEAIGEKCCHVSVAIDRKIGKQYLDWVISRLSGIPALRRNVPNSSSVSCHDFLSDVKNSLTEGMCLNDIAHYRSALLIHSRPRQFYDFLVVDPVEIESIVDSKDYSFTLESRFSLTIESDEEWVWFSQCSKKFSYPVYAKEVLTLLAENIWVGYPDLQEVNQGRCSDEEIKSLLIGLVQEGVGRIKKGGCDI